jgi:head-tail adaptor
LAKLARVLLARDNFETVADLTEALKVECGRLRIRWTPDDITAAYRLIESNRPLLGFGRRPPVNPRHVERIDDVRPLSKDDAKDLWSRLSVALVREQANPRRRA